MKKRDEIYDAEEIDQLDSLSAPKKKRTQTKVKSSGSFFSKVFPFSKDNKIERELYKKAERDMQELNVDQSCRIYYETLRDRIFNTPVGDNGYAHSLAFTSCSDGEGVTTIAINYASTLGRHKDGKILIVDANIEHPAIHKFLKVNRSPGLSEILANEIPYEAAVNEISSRNISVIPAGKKSKDIAYFFEEKVFANFLESIKRDFDYVVFDAPPMCHCHGKICICSTGNVASKVGNKLDGVIFVIESERIRYHVAQQAKEQLEYGGAKILGVVLNKRKFHIPKWIYNTIK